MAKQRRRLDEWRRLSPAVPAKTAVDSLVKAVRSGNWAYGQRASTVERRIAGLFGADPAQVIATASCTAALQAAHAAVFGPRHSPAVCPLTWPGTYAWCDSVQFCDLNDPAADISVDLWGIDAPHAPIVDAAHNFLSARHVKAIRENTVAAVCYSFGPQKEVCSPAGGAVVFGTTDLAVEAREALAYGTRGRTHIGWGINGLMTEPTAAMVAEHLSLHNQWKARRQRVLEEYEHHLGGMLITKPGVASGHLCVIDCQTPEIRELYIRSLNKSPSVPYGRHYPVSQEQRAKCPKAAELSDRVISLPCHRSMVAYDVRRVCARILGA